MMKARYSFEASVTSYQSTRRKIPEASNLQQHRCENLECRINLCSSTPLGSGALSTVLHNRVITVDTAYFLRKACCTVWPTTFRFTHFMKLFMMSSLSLAYVDVYYNTCLMQSEYWDKATLA
jgi:hypothetical protein